MTTTRRRQVERRVSAVVILYNAELTDPDGKRVEVTRNASRGALVTLTPREAARLDALGMLAPVGATIADVESDAEIVLEAYRAARQSVSGPAW